MIGLYGWRAGGRAWRTRSELELAIVEWVGWYKHQRLHSSLDDSPPVEFEAIHDYEITGTVDLPSSFDLSS